MRLPCKYLPTSDNPAYDPIGDLRPMMTLPRQVPLDGIVFEHPGLRRRVSKELCKGTSTLVSKEVGLA
jgi:hypothetical protein